jgi:hypothetical protein
MELLKVFRNLEKIGGQVDWTNSAIVQLLQHLPPHAQDPSLSHSEDGFTPVHTPPPRTLAPKKDRWHEDRRVLLLSEVGFWTESGDPIAPRSPTETEFAQLPLALVLPDYGQNTYLFLYRNGLRLRIDFRELDSFSWWFDDVNPSILVFKIGGKKFAAEAVDGEQVGDPRPPEDWIFWEKFVLERQDSAVECFQNHLITIRARAHSEAGARAVGEFGRLLDKTRFGRKDVLGGEVGGPASHSRVTTSVVDVVVVFALFVRSLSLTMGFALFLVRLFVLFSLSVCGVRSEELVQYIDWGSGCRSIQSTHHFTHF